jgi:Tfp pilus assembly protein PilN
MAIITNRPSEEVSINLLPSEIRSDQKTRRNFQFAVAGAVTILVILGIITVFYRLQIAHQEDVLREAQAERTALQAQVDALREFEILKANNDAARATLATALAGDINWTKFLDDLDAKWPGDATLTSLSATAATGTTPLGEASLGTAQYAAKINGSGMPGLASWLDTMSEITGLRFVYLGSGSKAAGGSDVTFSATAHLTEQMLSGRCKQEGSKCP